MVISTTGAAGRDVTIRRILGLWPGVRVRVSRLIRSRTRSVVQGASCLGDRAPARISAITWANCLDQAATGSGAPSAGRPALNVSEGPGGSAPSGAPRSGWAHGLGTDTSRAGGHRSEER